jgi:predicted ArsR family transcriptional regulator
MTPPLHVLRTPIAVAPPGIGEEPQESELLIFIRTQGPCSVRTVKARLGISDSAASSRLRRLEEKGQIVRAGLEPGSHGGCAAVVWRAVS